MAAFVAFVNPLLNIIDRVIPDRAQAAATKNQILIMQAKGELDKEMLALQAISQQSQVNLAEASSGNKYAADWRPTFGYVCAFSFAWAFIVQPFVLASLQVYSYYAHATPFDPKLLPVIDMSTMMPIALGMLGLVSTHVGESVSNAITAIKGGKS